MQKKRKDIDVRRRLIKPVVDNNDGEACQDFDKNQDHNQLSEIILVGAGAGSPSKKVDQY